ncbi:MAG TPA: hypothetical protein VFT99_03865 [Roseiflexaceae bacterium]|nr:hypothetical protein [Roseiflexaceae bacterium]
MKYLIWIVTLVIVWSVTSTSADAVPRPYNIQASWSSGHQITATWQNVPPGGCVVAVEAGQPDRVLACDQARGAITFDQPRNTTVRVETWWDNRVLSSTTVLPVSVSVAWSGPRSVVITWSGMPPGACVRRNGVILSDTCSARGSLTLPTMNIDDAYAFEGGDVVDVWLSGEVLASATLPDWRIILPLVVAPQ